MPLSGWNQTALAQDPSVHRPLTYAPEFHAHYHLQGDMMQDAPDDAHDRDQANNAPEKSDAREQQQRESDCEDERVEVGFVTKSISGKASCAMNTNENLIRNFQGTFCRTCTVTRAAGRGRSIIKVSMCVIVTLYRNGVLFVAEFE